MMYPVTIRPALNGWTVEVGCQKLVFSSTETLLSELEQYLREPFAREKFYRENGINRKLLLPIAEGNDPVPAEAYRTYSAVTRTQLTENSSAA